ncbi:MAG: VPLPA-CTERM sorting domain-containing protein [Parvularculaceae bacterium]|nr:VPLPA-CTERM sorting domain-containing protein [Parvularculaceae bacterium]
MKNILASTIAGALLVGTSFAATTTYTDRATYEAAADAQTVEDFETLSGTTTFTGPWVGPSGLIVSTETNNMFSVGPGQSTNPTQGIGSNNPPTDSMTLDLGGDFFSFGLDIFQNNGGGGQTGTDQDYIITVFDDGAQVGQWTATVASNGGSFFGAINMLAFDMINISNRSLFEVVDNVSWGNGSVAPVPVPGALPLMLAGLGALGVAKRKKKSA